MPYFFVAGHFNYTKSAYLYIQEIVKFVQNAEKEIASLHEEDIVTESAYYKIEELKNFIVNGFSTIRRTDKFWSGNFTDMTIEQVLMLSLIHI